MMAESDTLLSEALGRVVPRGFFAPLARPERAGFFIDCIDRLERESAAQAGEIGRREALQLISETLTEHGDIDWTQEADSALADTRARANAIFNRLLAARWLDERDLGIDDRRVIVEPTVRWLLDALRKMSATTSAELHSFADTLRGICDELADSKRFDPAVQSGEELVARLGDLSRRAGTSTNQLNHVYLVLRQFIDRQASASTGRENLQLVFDEFAAGQHQVCHDELFTRGLFHRLGEARQTVQDFRWSAAFKEQLSGGVAQREAIDLVEARERVGALLGSLEEVLGSIAAMAREVDGRIAHFHRVSYERYSYLNDRSGLHAETIKQVFERVESLVAGRSILNMPALDLPALRVPQPETFHGVESLYSPRQRHTPVKMSGQLRPIRADDRNAIERLRRRYSESLSAMRGARFVRKHLPQVGAAITSNAFRTTGRDDVLDLISTLVHQRYGSVGWRIQHAGRDTAWHPERTPIDVHDTIRFERFTIRRLR
jgi:hypothetical protein